MQKLIKPGPTIALDREVQSYFTELAAKLADLALGGRNELAFIIGGTLGLAPAILEQADSRLSFPAYLSPPAQRLIS